MSRCFKAIGYFARFIFLPVIIQCQAISAYADNSYLSVLKEKAVEDELFLKQGWLALVHYKSTLLGGYESQADDDKFFIAENGRTSPKEELLATLSAFFSYSIGDSNTHSQCRFPARYYWLDKKLNFDKLKLKNVHCSKLEKWHEQIKPHSLDLIFPAAFLNGPSSMFGHTLLRVNSRDFRKELPLVSYALNYAADADASDGALFFSVKGLIGGYPGVFAIVPYYEKLNEYRDIENRDIWEYSLNFTQDEVQQLMRHAWELRYINFDYFYITENCSYHMLSFMEVARPGLKLTHLFDSKAIPVDTVRAVIDANLVKQKKYRASTTTVIEHHATELSEIENAMVVDLNDYEINLDDPRIESLPEKNYARVIEQAYDYSRFLSSANPSVRDIRAKQNWKLLTARSQVDVKKIWSDVPVPFVSPDESHETVRLAIGVGALERESFLSLKLRPVYHDLLDPIDGYASNSQINFFDLQIRYFDKSEKIELDKLTVINVLSLSPRSEYFSPISWGVDVGVEKVNSQQGRINAAQVIVDGGLSYSIGKLWVFSGLLEARVKAADRLDKGYSAGVGVRLNLLSQNSDFSTQLTLGSVSFKAGEENIYHHASIEQSFHFNASQSVRLVVARSKEYKMYLTKVELYMSWYY